MLVVNPARSCTENVEDKIINEEKKLEQEVTSGNPQKAWGRALNGPVCKVEA